MKMIGKLHCSSLSLACSSKPDIPGIWISAIRHPTSQCKSYSRNSSADPKHRATSPVDSIKSRSESCIDSSLSMMAINSDVWPLGMAQTHIASITACMSVYSQDETDGNETAAI